VIFLLGFVQVDRKEYLTNKSFCPVPWTGFMYNSDGDVKHCIRSPDILGNLADSGIRDIVTGDSAIRNKTYMLQKTPSPCMPWLL